MLITVWTIHKLSGAAVEYVYAGPFPFFSLFWKQEKRNRCTRNNFIFVYSQQFDNFYFTWILPSLTRGNIKLDETIAFVPQLSKRVQFCF